MTMLPKQPRRSAARCSKANRRQRALADGETEFARVAGAGLDQREDVAVHVGPPDESGGSVVVVLSVSQDLAAHRLKLDRGVRQREQLGEELVDRPGGGVEV